MYATSESFVRPRAKLKVVGTNYGTSKRPLNQRVREWRRVAHVDTTISAILNLLITSLLSTLGDIQHPDEEIQQYCRDNIARLRDEYNCNLLDRLYELAYTTLVSGYSVSENLFDVINGKLVLKDILCYDPATIHIYPDDNGRLVDLVKRRDGRLSGIYQQPYAWEERRLPLWKVNHLKYRSFFGNHYGESLIEPIYRWHLLSDALIDMMSISLDRYGNPFFTIAFPYEETTQMVYDERLGRDRPVTTQEIFEQKLLEREQQGLAGSFFFMPYMDKDRKPEVQLLTPPTNVGTIFIDALDYCDQNKARGLLTPFMLIGDTRQSVGNTPVERRIEVFYYIVSSLYRQMVVPFVSQSFHRLIKLAFSKSAAKYPPIIPTTENRRPEERVALMQLINGLTNSGYINPTNDSDWGMVREWVSAIRRVQESKDLQFIDDKVLQKFKLQQQGTGAKNPIGKTRNRTNEGNKQASRGRPPGTSAPQSNPRAPKTTLSDSQDYEIYEEVSLFEEDELDQAA